MESDASALSPRHDPYAALRTRDFRLYLPGSTLANLGMRMQSAAVLWEVYERTGSELMLGYVGLVQFLPVILLALPGGQAADRFSRRRIIMIAEVVIAVASLGLAVNSCWLGNVQLIFLFLLLTGVARAFQQPARSALVPQIVPRDRFSNAAMWGTTGFQLSSIMGPAVAGILIAAFHSATLVYVIDAVAAMLFFAALMPIHALAPTRSAERPTVRSLLAGAEFVWRNKLILGAITLDLFAVLLGGAVALLPVFAKDILRVGPSGYGLMEAAPSAGALVMSFALAHLPPLRRAGPTLLWCVVGFGLATVIFGLSRSFWLSLLMLFLTGVFDTVSVIVRHTLVQLHTPDERRGRVSAINGLFIGASNELGGFESGLVAHLTTPTFAVVSGGVGTVVVTAICAITWPELRRYGRLGAAEPAKPAVALPIPDPESETAADTP